MDTMSKELPITAHIRVNAQGTGDYPTIQAAIDAVPPQN